MRNNTLINCHFKSTEVMSRTNQLVKHIAKTYKTTPELHVILVGDNPASKTYVNNKIKRCDSLGIRSVIHHFDETVTEKELSYLIKGLNNEKEVNGIMLQLPLPDYLDSDKLINDIVWFKDVDGLTDHNQAMLLNDNQPRLEPCTPRGVMELLGNVEGKNVTVVGRSRLFGKPMQHLLTNANATVTLAHSKTKVLRKATDNADIVICAVGQARLFKGNYFKDGATIIDVGINRDKYNELCGDVDLENVFLYRDDIVATKVPGGVGLMTTAMLMENTCLATLIQYGE